MLLGVITDTSVSFEVHVDIITRIDFFHLKNIAKIYIMHYTMHALGTLG